MAKAPSTRLTNSLRDTIRKDVLRYRFFGDNKEFRSIQTASASLAMDIYNDTISAKNRELMATLPANWLPKINSVRVRLGSFYSQMDLSFSGAFYLSYSTRHSLPSGTMNKIDDVTMMVPQCYSEGFFNVYDHDHPFVSRGEDIKIRIGKLEEEAVKASRTLAATLSEVTTIKRLIEVWPEVKPFASKYENVKAPSTELSVPVSTLNQMFELPVPA